MYIKLPEKKIEIPLNQMAKNFGQRISGMNHHALIDDFNDFSLEDQLEHLDSPLSPLDEDIKHEIMLLALQLKPGSPAIYNYNSSFHTFYIGEKRLYFLAVSLEFGIDLRPMIAAKDKMHAFRSKNDEQFIQQGDINLKGMGIIFEGAYAFEDPNYNKNLQTVEPSLDLHPDINTEEFRMLQEEIDKASK